MVAGVRYEDEGYAAHKWTRQKNLRAQAACRPVRNRALVPECLGEWPDERRSGWRSARVLAHGAVREQLLLA